MEREDVSISDDVELSVEIEVCYYSPWLRFVHSGANKKSFLISRPNTLKPSSPTLASSPSRSRIVKDTIFDLKAVNILKLKRSSQKLSQRPWYLSQIPLSILSIYSAKRLTSLFREPVYAPITSSTIQTEIQKMTTMTNLHVDSHFLTLFLSLIPSAPLSSGFGLNPHQRLSCVNDRIHTTRHCLAHC